MERYNIILFGGSSTIGIKYLLLRIKTLKRKNKNISIILIGKNKNKLNSEKKNFQSIDIKADFQISNFEKIDKKVIKTINNNKLDEVIFSYGKLFKVGKKQQYLQDIKRNLDINLQSKLLYLEAVAIKIEKQKKGLVVVLGSVAGDLGKKSNYPYGAANAALENYVEGLQHKLSKFNMINISLIKLGFVESNMTDHIKNKNLLWISSSSAAKRIEIKVLNKTKKSYVPFFWFWIMLTLKNLPKFIFNKLNI